MERLKEWLRNGYYIVSIGGFAILIWHNWQFQADIRIERDDIRAERKTNNDNTITMLAWMSAMNGNFKELSGMVKVLAPELKKDIRLMDGRQGELMKKIDKAKNNGEF